MSNAATYKNVMDAIAAGQPVDRDAFETAVQYAKTAKRKAPKTDLFLVPGATTAPERKVVDGKVVVEATATAKKTTTKPVAKKAAAKATTKKAPATKKAAAPKVVKDCAHKGCTKKAYAKGLCSQHYTQMRRQDPAQREAANEASRLYRLRHAKPAEKKAAKKAPAKKAATTETASA